MRDTRECETFAFYMTKAYKYQYQGTKKEDDAPQQPHRVVMMILDT